MFWKVFRSFCDSLIQSKMTLRKCSVSSFMTRGHLLVSLVFYTLTAIKVASTAGQTSIIGSPITCHNEGGEVLIPRISEDPCISCKCQHREVVCKHENCPNQPSCYILLLGKHRKCCESCKGCLWKGTFKANSKEWIDPEQPCFMHSCQAGVLTSTKIQCHVPCRHPIAPGPGQCCPSCPSPGCQSLGEPKADEKDTPDPCVQCSCKGPNLFCWKRACPVLPCPNTRFSQKPGQCCPQCKGVKKSQESLSQCDLGQHILTHGQKVNYDSCTDCTCNGSTTNCRRLSCPALNCPPVLRVHPPEKCCPHCRGQEEQTSICSFKGKIYRDGETWKLDKCSQCLCQGTRVHCEFQDCSNLPPCPPRFTLKTLPGECCPTCIEEDAICSMFGEANFRTFDGRIYHLPGFTNPITGVPSVACRYLLTRECPASDGGNAFAINVVSDVKNKLPAKSIIVKVDSTKVQLGHNHRVRVGRKRVKLPFIKLGVLSINMENETVLVRTNVGFKIVWDGRSYLEISAPTQFKNKLCGLCGNYNGDVSDDLRSKKGQTVSDPYEFGQSWLSGKKAECRRRLTHPVTNGNRSLVNDCGQTYESRTKARRECAIFKQNFLSGCQGNVNPAPYFQACMVDVCQCSTNSKKCHCEATKAYVRECQRAGLNMTSWRNATNCATPYCPDKADYTQCGGSCRKSCSREANHVCRVSHCQAGCECSAGLVYHRNRCIAPQHCPKT